MVAFVAAFSLVWLAVIAYVTWLGVVQRRLIQEFKHLRPHDVRPARIAGSKTGLECPLGD